MMVRLQMLLPLFVLPLTLAAQATGSVRGSVVFADTGKPAAAINLWLESTAPSHAPEPDPITGEYEIHDREQRPQRLPAKMSADGNFVLSGVPAGDYGIHVFAQGYLSPDGTVYPASRATHVAAGPLTSPGGTHVMVRAGEVSKVAVRLQRGGAIEGFVKQANGAAVVSDTRPPYGVAVNAMRRLGEGAYARTGGAAHTDGNGHYRLENLPPGDYVVFAAVMSGMVPTGTGLMAGGALPIFAPGTPRADKGTVVHIAGAETAHADFHMPDAAMMHRVEGSVVVSGKDAVQMVIVRLFPKGEGGVTASAPLRSDAKFSFHGVPDGEYTLSIEFPKRQEFVSADTQRGVVRMRLHAALYEPLTRDITVSGHDVAGVQLRPVASKTQAAGR